jgi:DNA-binding CsgD family transcriptional regulator
VLQPRYSYDPEDPGVALTRAARERGVETELVTLPTTVEAHPLLSSIFPATLLGPVFLRGLVVDGRHAIVGGPADAVGRRVAWYTTMPAVVDDVIDLWRATVPLCRPILAPGETPPLTERQLEVARLMCVGVKDHVIARTLLLSPRTVEREVARILSVLEAGSRTEAVLLMRGRGVNGGRRGDNAPSEVTS